MIKTNVTRLLTAAGIPFRVEEYPVDESDLSGGHAADLLGISPDQLFKTLILKGEHVGYFVCCVPSSGEVDLKKAAKAAGDKKAAMIPMKSLKEVTGYIRGGCSPIGLKKPFPTFLDETAILFDEIRVSAGQRGVMVVIKPDDLVRYLNLTMVDLVKD